ncbi:MAG: diaminopimelate decarboxylase [Fusobacteriaceae bacterium]|jgi:diaminopimelate decarboxylase|nr:diaminopimelate decarboxylase [Fusobacteriaceae bacterium]
MKLFGTMNNNNGILEIGGISVTDLAKQFKTPLYIMDQALIEKNIEKYKNGFKSDLFKTAIVYASKAFLSKGICQIVDKYGLDIDAVSGGELYAIKSSNFPMDRVHMDGNNKSLEELEMCIDYGIDSIIIDNIPEVINIQNIASKKDKKINALLRLNIGIDAHTHEYIKTSKNNSKFGESIYDNKIYKTMETIINSKNINFLGFHCHIGSQIFDMKSFYEAIDIMLDFSQKISLKFGNIVKEINLGGGFGVYYTEKDVAVDLEEASKLIIKYLEKSLKEKSMELEKVSIEPGRSIVANAGSTLYTVGGTKETYGGLKYIFVDGGMADNIRPALYQAEYEAAIVNKMNEEPSEDVSIAGKCCESGDIVVKNYKIAKAEIGDLVLTPTTGAYGHTMASNYNKCPIPAVVFVKDGKAKISIKRQSYEDMIINDDFIEL